MGLLSKFFSNARKPEGFLGKIMVNGMNGGGQFVIVNESDGHGAMDAKWESMIEGMHTYTPEEIQLHLTNAGFHDLNITVNEEKRWLCVTAR
jgi:hypothetical protein